MSRCLQGEVQSFFSMTPEAFCNLALTDLISLSPPLTHTLVCLLTVSLSTLSQALIEVWYRSPCFSVPLNPISVLQQVFPDCIPLPSWKFLVPPSVCLLCLLPTLFLNMSHLCSGFFHIYMFPEGRAHNLHSIMSGTETFMNTGTCEKF